MAGARIPAPRVDPGTPAAHAREVLRWRRRALDQQLPAASFPAGAAAPSLVYFWAVLVVATAAVLGFAIHDQRGVAPAVQESQRDLMSKIARSMSLGVQQAVDEFDRFAGRVRGTAQPVDKAALAGLVGADGQWAGAAVLDAASKRPLAATGVALPVDQLAVLPPDGQTVPVMTADGLALVRAAALQPGQVLLALHPVTMRNLRLNPDAQHGVFTRLPDGRVVLMQGVSALPEGKLPEVFAHLAGLGSSQSRTVVVREWSDRQLVVSAAPVGDTGVTVASLLVAEVTDGTSLWRGLMLGSGVLLAGTVGFLLMRASLARPVAELLKQAKADACGAVTSRRRVLRMAEAYRIARGLAVSSYAALPGKRWRPTVLQGLVVAAVVALLCPAVAVTLSLRPADYPVDRQLVADEESRAEAISTTLGNALDNGRQRVDQVAFANADTPADRMDAALRQALRDEHRLRAVYVVDAAGTVVRSAGREPLRAVGPLPGAGGLRIDPAIERLPLIYAYRVRADGGGVVGEFDTDYLVGLMRQADGRARVVDSTLRTVLDSEGYRAFQPLLGEALRAVAADALTGETAARSGDTDGDAVLVAGSAVQTPAPVAHLEWVVVVERNVSMLRLPQMLERRWTLLISAAFAGVVLLTLAWQHFIYVRPLRRLAAAADRVAAGDFEEPIAPQRHDDVGAIAMCLEICRQVRHTGSARFGGAVRLRGPEENYTAVLPLIPRQKRSDRATRV